MRLIDLRVEETEDKGRGIFSNIDIPEHSIIEICPLIIIPNEELIQIDKTKLYDYYFVWDEDKNAALALGYGSLYNHSDSANAIFTFQKVNHSLIVKSLRQINANEEITVDYTGGSGELWFTRPRSAKG